MRTRQYRRPREFDVTPYVETGRRIQEADVRAALAKRRALANGTYPGFVYVVELDSAVIKVGKSTSPLSRIASHATMAGVHGQTIARQWISPRHPGFETSERRLIDFCKQHGQSAGRHEYFREIGFELVSEFADMVACEALTAERKVLDTRRREYLDDLIEAAGGDMTMTFGEARALLALLADSDPS